MSSSSDDESVERLKEALAPGFTIDSGKKPRKPHSNKGQEACPSMLKSLRKPPEEDFIQEYRNPNITPQQQTFIAKKLDEYIETQIKEIDTLSKQWPNGAPNSKGGKKGIKLFSNSKKRVKCDVLEPEIVNQRRPEIGKKRNTESLSHSEMVKEAAVSPDWVLGKQGAFGRLSWIGEVISGAQHSPQLSKKLKE